MSGKFSELYGSKGGSQPSGGPQAEASPPGQPIEGDGAIDPAVYIGFDANRNGRPTMGFFIAHKDGTLDGFMYQGINHPKFQVRDGEEFLTFTDSGTAVVMTGSGLRQIFEALMRHTLKAVYEYDGRRPVKDGVPIITRLSVKHAVPARTEQPLELVKPSRQAI
jgi:hypothetical protein